MMVSLKRRITLLILGVSTTVLLLASSAFFTVEILRYRRSFRQEATNLSRIISIEVSERMMRHGVQAVHSVLHALEVYDWIEYAALVDTDGLLLAGYSREKAYAHRFAPGQELMQRADPAFSIMAPVSMGDEVAGTLIISYEFVNFKNIVIGYGAITLLILVVSALTAVVLSIRVQRFVSVPIRRITGAIRQMAQNANYALRLPPQNTNEFDQLVEALNAMMNDFQNRDEQLKKSYANLEKIIEQRTTELKNSNRDLTREIKERERIERDLIKAKELAESAVRARSSFLANMSHEIRTPMNAILGFADLLEGRVSDPESRSYLESILASGNTLMRLINDILDLSKVEAGKLDLQYRTFDPRVMLKEIEQIFSPLVMRKKIALRANIDPSLPTSLMLDEIRLRQVLLNLVGNAVKFTDEGYVQVSLFMCNFNENQTLGELVVVVEDTGQGIARDQFQSIFDAFSQQEGQDSGKYGGTGLGLTITRRLIEMMGGTISLESEPGKGAVFEVHIPNVAIGGQSPVCADEPDQVVHFRNSKILLVDDNRMNRLLCRKYMARPEFEVIEAENGREALALANTQHPDMILLDVKMPVMDGYETLKTLKNDDTLRPIPVVVLTASAMRDEEERMYKAGCDGYLKKPLSKQALMEELAKYLSEGYVAGPHGAPSEAATGETTAELSEETRRNLPAVISAMEGDMYARWDAVRKTYVIGDIEGFAAAMHVLAATYGLAAVAAWAEKLLQQARAFDMEHLPDTLAMYPNLIEALKDSGPTV